MKLYSETFKKSVVKKVLSEGVIMTQVADRLNISPSTLREWVNKYRDEVTPEAPDLDAIIDSFASKLASALTVEIKKRVQEEIKQLRSELSDKEGDAATE